MAGLDPVQELIQFIDDHAWNDETRQRLIRYVEMLATPKFEMKEWEGSRDPHDPLSRMGPPPLYIQHRLRIGNRFHESKYVVGSFARTLMDEREGYRKYVEDSNKRALIEHLVEELS